jgi:hypothetical protein
MYDNYIDNVRVFIEDYAKKYGDISVFTGSKLLIDKVKKPRILQILFEESANIKYSHDENITVTQPVRLTAIVLDKSIDHGYYTCNNMISYILEGLLKQRLLNSLPNTISVKLDRLVNNNSFNINDNVLLFSGSRIILTYKLNFKCKI